MSLRVKLFVLFGGLIALLVGAEWWLVRSLRRAVSVEVVNVASHVSQQVVRLYTGESAPPGLPRGERHFVVIQGPNAPIRIPIPEGGPAAAVAGFRQQLLLGSLAILGIGLAAAAVVADRVSAPLRELAGAARAVGEGGAGLQVAVRSGRGLAGGEVGEAILAFNQMSARLVVLERQALAHRESQHLGELGEVARGLAHALRNPLNALGLSVEELASRSPGDPEAIELADAARRQIRRVDGSVRSFLALANGGAGAEEEVDARELVAEVVLEALQDSRGRVRVVVGEAFPGDPPARLRGIPAEVRAVVQALVVNAIEASPDGAVVEVRVDSRPTGGATLTVDDRGPGLPPEVRARLFTPHVTTKPSGSGMGLFLAHRIAASRYGGDLSLTDREGGGTRAVLSVGSRGDAAGA